MPVLPLVGSISVVLPGWIFPAFSASLIMLTPIRSFTLAHGLKLSSLATIKAATPLVTRFRRTSGVLPISSVTSLAIFMNALHAVRTQPEGFWFQISQLRGNRASSDNNDNGNCREQPRSGGVNRGCRKPDTFTPSMVTAERQS